MVQAGAITQLTTVDRGTLSERLFARGWEFDFFQVVWLLERYGDVRVRVGERGPVAAESFRFRPDVALCFSPTDVRRVTRARDPDGRTAYYGVDVTFMGLYGVSTPLPLHYAISILRSTESVGEPQTQKTGQPGDSSGDERPAAPATPMRDFLDIFHHRLISLFYRSWLKYRYDRAFGIANRDVLTDYFLWLIGCPRAYDEAVLGVPPVRLLRYGGILTQHPRSATTLEGMLGDYWGDVDVASRQCVGRWVAVAARDRNCIGIANSHLGYNVTVGDQVYDLSGAFRVVIGPTDWATYLSFLPGAERYGEARALIRHYCADPLSCSIEVRIRAREVPELALRSDEKGGRLGFTSWARTGEMPETSVRFAIS